ncbi:MAG TPA: hypothetical protein VHF92_09480 [Geodermatophilus sp.]|nr:hypothetical protein [Geodermatophilus sp.]
MNRWVKRGLQTALLTGGLLAAGAGVASADENDITADVLGATTTVPVQDGTVVDTPVVTGTGEDLTVTGGDAGGISLPVNTDTEPGTTVLGGSTGDGVSAPVRVTEAVDSPPDPADGVTVTVPVNTSGGSDAGTTVTVPIVTGNLGDVLDEDPLSGNSVDVDLDGPLVPGPSGSGVVLDVEDLVTIGDTDGTTTPDTVLEVPASLEEGEPSTVSLPVPLGDADGDALTGNDVDVHLGSLIGDGSQPADGNADGTEPALSVPVDTGDLSGLPEGNAASDNTVDVHLGDLLGAEGSGTGSVITVPVNEGRDGTGGDNLVRVTVPFDLPGAPAEPGEPGEPGLPGLPGVPGPEDGSGDGEEPGTGPGTAPGTAPGTDAGTAPGTGGGSDGGSGDGTAPAYGAGYGAGDELCTGHGEGTGYRSGTATANGTSAGTSGGTAGTPPAGGETASALDPCAVATAGTRWTMPHNGTSQPLPTALLAMTAGLLLAAVGRRLWATRG